MELALIVLALAIGAGLPVQAGLNAALARYAARPEWAAFVNFAVGFLGLAVWLVATRAPWPTTAALAKAPAWAWTGGLLGAFYVSAVVVLAPRLGVAMTLGLSVAGQMVGALLIDHYGLFGLATRSMNAQKVVGAALLVVAVILLRR